MTALKIKDSKVEIPKRKMESRIPKKLIGDIESPKRIMLFPAVFSNNANWFNDSDSGLVKGLKIKGVNKRSKIKEITGVVGYQPVLIPTTWSGKKAFIKIEHLVETENVNYGIRLRYGCKDSQKIKDIELKSIASRSGKILRLKIELSSEIILAEELFRVTMWITRNSDFPIILQGCWLELEV